MNLFKYRQQKDETTGEIAVTTNDEEKMEPQQIKIKRELSDLNGSQSTSQTAVSPPSQLPPPPPKPSTPPVPTIAATPYPNSKAHLWDEMLRIDQLVRAQTLRWRMTIAAAKPDHLWGMLHVTDAEVDAYFQSPFAPPNQLPEALEQALKPYWHTAVKLSQAIDHRRRQSDVPLWLDRLQSCFNLSDYEKDVLLVCLLSEVDSRYRRLFGYLQDDVSRTRPTIDLILQILQPVCPHVEKARAAFLPQNPLCANHLLTVDENGRANESTAMQTAQIDPRIVAYLLGHDQPDSRLERLLTIPPPLDWSALHTTETRLRQLQSLAATLPASSHGAICQLHGPYGSGRQSAARAICSVSQTPLFVIDVQEALQAAIPWRLVVDLCYREAMLWQTAVYWAGCDQLFDNEQTLSHWHYLLDKANQHHGLTFLGCERQWQPDGRFLLPDKPFLQIHHPIPSYEIRCHLWETPLAHVNVTNNQTHLSQLARLLANSFQFTEGQIHDAIITAQGMAMSKNPQSPQLTVDVLFAGCRQQSNKQLISMARRIEPRAALQISDIILPPANRHQLQELLTRIQNRSYVYQKMGFEKRLSLGKGIIALFAGSSGTGKTMAAELLANAQGVDLYKVDLSAVVSKYVGETEKNLNRVFQEAEGSNAIIVFDEADALFGKRGEVKDARDRWANMEINYLLQRIEEYAGVVILTTNLRQNIDDAFLRRIHVIIEFPYPNVEARFRILEGLFPDGIQRPPTDELFALADKFELTGGNLKNVVVEAAFRAVAENKSDLPITITQRHLVVAVGREYQKLAKPLTKGEFGQTYYGWIKKEILHHD